MSISSPAGSEHAIRYNLAVIALAVLLCGIGLTYAIEHVLEAERASVAAPAGEVTRILVGKSLSIPTAWLRDGGERAQDRFVSEVDLAIPLPLGRNGAETVVGVKLLPRSRARPSALLIDGVYLHQFQPNELSGPPGLIGKPLYGNDGYENETAWYDPLSVDPFVAKCMSPVVPGASARCLRTVYVTTGIAAVYDFDSSVLWSWRQLDARMGRALTRIGL